MKEFPNEMVKFNNLSIDDKNKWLKNTDCKGDRNHMELNETSPGKRRMMNFLPSSGYSEQDSPRKYHRRTYKIPKSDVQGQSALDSHLEVIKAITELKVTR